MNEVIGDNNHTNNNKGYDQIEINEFNNIDNNENGEEDIISNRKKERIKIYNKTYYDKQKHIKAENCRCLCGGKISIKKSGGGLNQAIFNRHAHTNIHYIFKLFIKLIHIKRKNNTIKNVITDLKDEWKYYKTKKYQENNNGKMICIITMSDGRIISRWKKIIRKNKIDENEYPQLKPSTINKVDYNQKYKNKINKLRNTILII